MANYLKTSIAPGDIQKVIAHELIKKNVKESISNYINSFLAVTGKNRLLTSELAAKPISFRTDIPSSGFSSSTKINFGGEHVALSLPCIIIHAKTVRFHNTGVSATDDITYDNGDEIHSLLLKAAVPVALEVVTNSESDTDCLATWLCAMFGPLKMFADGMLLKSVDKSFQLTPPIQAPEYTLESNNVQDSQTDKQWSAKFTELQFDYEAQIAIRIATDTKGSLFGHVAPPGVDKEPVLHFDQAVKVGKEVVISVEYMLESDTIEVDFQTPVNSYEEIAPNAIKVYVRDNRPFSVKIMNANTVRYEKEITPTLS